MITSFRGEHAFLSNFFLCKIPILMHGIEFPTVEHAYVASKTLDPGLVKHISSLPSAGEAKRFGRSFELRPNFNDLRLPIMQNLLEQKFSNPDLMTLLHSTKPQELIEGNDWGDRFWGQSPIGAGHNHLGRILMSLRDCPF